MGLDAPSLFFLHAAKCRGVDFANLATIGRQSLRLAPEELAQVFRKLDIPIDAAKFLREANGYGESFYRLMGANEITSVDASPYEGAAVVHDLNVPIDKSLEDRFSVVHDAGSLEHVFNYPQAIKNCMEMVQVGGHFIQVTNANNFMGHGFYQFSPELVFRVFCKENGFSIESVILHEAIQGGKWYRVTDPKLLGKRVELCNRQPTYIMVLAKKMAKTAIFAKSPQQSDYQAIWEHGRPEQVTRINNGPSKSISRWVRKATPERIKNIIKAVVASKPPSEFQTDCYREIDETSIIQGLID